RPLMQSRPAIRETRMQFVSSYEFTPPKRLLRLIIWTNAAFRIQKGEGRCAVRPSHAREGYSAPVCFARGEYLSSASTKGFTMELVLTCFFNRMSSPVTAFP